MWESVKTKNPIDGCLYYEPPDHKGKRDISEIACNTVEKEVPPLYPLQRNEGITSN